jgi:hypothetical protein
MTLSIADSVDPRCDLALRDAGEGLARNARQAEHGSATGFFIADTKPNHQKIEE